LNRTLLAALLLAGTASTASADVQPQPVAPAAPIAVPKDVAYPGALDIKVNATDLTRHIFKIEETVPVASAGAMTLLYPNWLPGVHAPGGPIQKFAALKITANGKTVPWTRDPVDVYAFHIDVPKGVKSLSMSFDFLSSVTSNEGRLMMTPAMMNVEWNTVALYPAGYFTRDIKTNVSITLPAGWKYGTALRAAKTDGDTITFKPVTFNTLVDSPLIAGKYFRKENLNPGGKVPVTFNVVADRPDLLQITPKQLQAHRNLVQQAYNLFGSQHYNHYDFLLWLSNQMGGEGLEHHRSSEDGVGQGYFVHWDQTTAERDLLAHEFTHSWNGKFRRPADLWTPNFNVPMRDSLLWMYEGQTQYWGYVLAARSGLWTKSQALGALAFTAAVYDDHVGHEWRSVEDTTHDESIAHRRPIPWRNFQLSEDYYSVGQLTWLDADTLIRKLTHGRKSLDTFARAFFGIDNGSYVTHPYTFADIVKTLNGVVPYDWAKFLRAHFYQPLKSAPLAWVKRGGYKLVYTDKETAYEQSEETLRKQTNFLFSLGFAVNDGNKLGTVEWGSPAFKAGLTVGTKLVALNGEAFSTGNLKLAINWAKTHKTPIKLLVENNKTFRAVTIDYHDGLRYPHLVPITNGRRSLDAILAAK
jgi:predicted metalloprotease with PDZ domain